MDWNARYGIQPAFFLLLSLTTPPPTPPPPSNLTLRYCVVVFLVSVASIVSIFDHIVLYIIVRMWIRRFITISQNVNMYMILSIYKLLRSFLNKFYDSPITMNCFCCVVMTPRNTAALKMSIFVVVAVNFDQLFGKRKWLTRPRFLFLSHSVSLSLSIFPFSHTRARKSLFCQSICINS